MLENMYDINRKLEAEKVSKLETATLESLLHMGLNHMLPSICQESSIEELMESTFHGAVNHDVDENWIATKCTDFDDIGVMTTLEFIETMLATNLRFQQWNHETMRQEIMTELVKNATSLLLEQQREVLCIVALKEEENSQEKPDEEMSDKKSEKGKEESDKPESDSEN